MSNNTKKIKFVYNVDPDFKSYYINGAKGGIVKNYDFKIILYTDRVKIPVEEKYDDEGNLIRAYPPEDNDDKETIIERNVPCELIMSIPTLVEMRDFFDRIIKNAEAEVKKDVHE